MTPITLQYLCYLCNIMGLPRIDDVRMRCGLLSKDKLTIFFGRFATKRNIFIDFTDKNIRQARIEKTALFIKDKRGKERKLEFRGKLRIKEFLR